MKCNTPLLMNKLQLALDDAKLAVLPSEVHGVLTGLICGGVTIEGDGWKKPFLELVNDGEPLTSELNSIVRELYLDIINSLLDPELSFSPMLAEDDEALSVRLEAFIHWVQSFLTGMAMVQHALDKASEDVQELIRDLTDFTQVELDIEENEANEEGFEALIEHARIAVWECLREFRGFDQLDEDNTSPTTLH